MKSALGSQSMLNKLKSLLQDPPPSMAFEISEAGIAAARIGARAELDFQPLKPGVITVSPIKENVADPDEFVFAVRSLAGTQSARKRKDVALILPDYCARIAVLDFDQFPSDPKEQASLIRFRLKRSVPFDVESAAMSFFAQPASGGKVDVVVAMTPLEIISRYEAPFRTAGLNPGLVTTSSLAVLELAPETGLSVIAKLTGGVLTVLVRDQANLKLIRCLELSSTTLGDISAVLIPTFVYIEDNLGRPAEKLLLCGFGEETEEAVRRFSQELAVETEPLRSPLGMPGESNAGLLGYLRSIARNN
jgi:type IV pilus assembly protein PilM